MKNYIQPGETITLPAPADVASGDAVLVGAVFGVASATAVTGADVEVARRGVFEMAKKTAQAWTAGAKLYWDATNSEVTTTASGNTLIGAAAVAAASADVLGKVLLDGVVR